jgi:hypothetical protein
MDSREVLEQEIEQLEAQLQHLEARLKPRKAALAALLKDTLAEGQAGSPATRFSEMQTVDAVQEILGEHGKPMKKAELRKILLDGGIGIRKKYPEKSVNVSIKVSAKSGKITRSGKGEEVADSELIGLPEWSKKK